MEADQVLAVLDALEGAGIHAGMTGGWGVDALLRRQTRAHSDLDLGLPSESVDAAQRELALLGYALVLDERPARLVLEGPHGRVDLHPIRWDDTGAGLQTGFNGQVFEYPPGSLDAAGEIAGRAVRCATPELQVAFHQGYAHTERDRMDMIALASAYGPARPAIHAD